MIIGMGSAYADRVDAQMRRLRSTSYKVRVSAVLQLSKSKSDRAVVAVAGALDSDSRRTVRSLAALSLAAMVNRRTSVQTRKRAVAVLSSAARKDSSRKVRQAARRSLERLATAEATSNTKSARHGSVFLHLGNPLDSTKLLSSRDRGELQRAVSRTFKKHAPDYGLGTNTTELPTRSELERKHMHGFYVGAQVAQLSVQRRGSRAEIRCKVAVRVGPWIGRGAGERIVARKSASASGSARVVGSGSRRGIALSRRDCVVAVAEEVTARQVVPFIRRVAR